MKKCKILLVENQKCQFKIIIDLFKHNPGEEIEFDIFPQEKGYEDFIDNIRVYLNKYYKEEVRNKALDNVIAQISNFNANKDLDFFVIDHKLVGCHYSFSGIDLAKELKKNYNFNQFLIFLSRTSPLNEDVMNNLVELKEHVDYEWVSKGYAGKEILQPEYFNKEVKNRLIVLFKEHEEKSTANYMKNIYHKLLNLPSSHPGHFKDLDVLKSAFDYNNTTKVKYICVNHEEIKNIYESYKDKLTDLNHAESFVKELEEFIKL